MRICYVDKYKKIINIRLCGYSALLLQLKTFQIQQDRRQHVLLLISGKLTPGYLSKENENTN